MGDMCEKKRQSKKADIDNLLQQTANYVNEGRVLAEEINIVLLQERPPEPKGETGLAACSTTEKCGWFDTVINRLSNIINNVGELNAHLANVHKEVMDK